MSKEEEFKMLESAIASAQAKSHADKFLTVEEIRDAVMPVFRSITDEVPKALELYNLTFVKQDVPEQLLRFPLACDPGNQLVVTFYGPSAWKNKMGDFELWVLIKANDIETPLIELVKTNKKQLPTKKEKLVTLQAPMREWYLEAVLEPRPAPTVSPAVLPASLLTFEQYSQVAHSTAIYPPERGLEYCTLGLISEAGEIAGKLKKAIRDNNGVLAEEARLGLKKEAGDCLWYISEIAGLLGSSLAEIASDNNKKLLDRQKRNVLGGSGDNR